MTFPSFSRHRFVLFSAVLYYTVSSLSLLVANSLLCCFSLSFNPCYFLFPCSPFHPCSFPHISVILFISSLHSHDSSAPQFSSVFTPVLLSLIPFFISTPYHVPSSSLPFRQSQFPFLFITPPPPVVLSLHMVSSYILSPFSNSSFWIAQWI